ncbi:MAG: exodeoxyribonuclease III [Burkholderiaceae bacterium]
MKLATWNVNSLNTRLPHLLQWLAANPVDVIGLQELKLTDDKFPFEALREAGYHAEAVGQKTYNGVALLSRTPVCEVLRNIPGLDDEQARVITATLDTPAGPMRLINAYFVNGQEPGSDKFAYKLRWLDALLAHVKREIAAHERLVLMGDFNVAPEDRDSHDPEGLRGTIHHTDEERAHFRALLDAGLTDAFRLFEHPPKTFSWWDYRMLGFQKNRGLRIDHVLVSAALKHTVQACAVDRTPRKWDKPSDHAPVVAELNL